MDIALSDLSFAYVRENPILRNVDLKIPSGTSVAVLGASGCGKSTLLKLIAGLIGGRASKSASVSGDISIGSGSILQTDATLADLKRRGKIGYLFQTPVLLDHMTVRENISLPTRVINQANAPRVQELIELVGLAEHADKYPKHLSGGMRTRTALARLFSTDPELLLLDEPFSALDIARRSNLYREFDKLRDLNKTTTVLVTHDIFEAMVFSGELCVMNLRGSAFPYRVENWRPNRSYEEVVRENFDCFASISEIIKSDA